MSLIGAAPRIRTVRQSSEVTARVGAAVGDAPDAWTAATRGVSAFLDACQDPEMVRIGLTDAPAVLGWSEWRAIEAGHGLGLITAGIAAATAEGTLPPGPAEVPAHLILAALIAAALLIASAPDPAAARGDAERTLPALMAGLRLPPEPRRGDHDDA